VRNRASRNWWPVRQTYVDVAEIPDAATRAH